MNRAQEIAKALLDVGAVSLASDKPFVWASGLRSPIYCDNRITLSYPDVRRMIAKALAEMIREYYPTVELIAGTATAGIPQACWVADLLDLPMIYIRSKPKDHGKGNQIEGKYNIGQKVVVIDDLISTGGSVIEASLAARSANLDVLGVVSVFSYQLAKAEENFEAASLRYVSLSDYSSLVEVALSEHVIDHAQMEFLKTWRKDPVLWSQTFD